MRDNKHYITHIYDEETSFKQEAHLSIYDTAGKHKDKQTTIDEIIVTLAEQDTCS